MADKDGDKKKDGEGLDLSKNPVIVEMGKQLKGLGVLLTQQQQQSAKTNENLGSLIESIKAGDLSKDKDKDKNIDPNAINELENAQLVPLVLEEVGKLLDTKLGDMGKRIDSTNKDITDDKLETELKAVVSTNPDFFEWSGEIKKLAEGNNNLSIKQLYDLARSESPEKAEEMTEKYKKDDEGDKDKDKPGLIGFMPTSGVTVEDDEKLTKKEASEKAWDEMLEEFPEAAQLGDG